MKTPNLTKAENRIAQAMEAQGEYTHNAIGVVLAGVTKEYGVESANRLVVLFDLATLYGIQPVKVAKESSKTMPTQITGDSGTVPIYMDARHQLMLQRIAVSMYDGNLAMAGRDAIRTKYREIFNAEISTQDAAEILVELG